MGTITEGPKHGHIFLQKDISGELDRVLATSQHSSIDTFLEHLFDLYTKASKTTQSVRVRDDVAQRFTALQCETRFQTSNDLMKHLLNLHIEYLKKANAETPKPTPPERHAPKKSRKSKPKRNFKLTEEVDSDEESAGHVTGGSSSDPWREMSVSSVEGSDDNVVKDPTEVDLSRVKQETVDGDEDTKSQKASLMKRIFHKNTDSDEDVEIVTTTTRTSSRNQSTLAKQAGKADNDKPTRQRKGSLKKTSSVTYTKKTRRTSKRKRVRVREDSDTDDSQNTVENDMHYLNEETRVACVNIENVEDGEIIENIYKPDKETEHDDKQIPVNDDASVSKEDAESQKKERLWKRSMEKPVRNHAYVYDCFKCGKKFKNRAPLNLHISKEHKTEVGILCKDCGKHVDYDHELELHKQFFCRKVKKTHKCCECKLTFISETEKIEHPCSMNPSKPYYCSVKDCTMYSRNVKDLTEHVTRHLGIKPFLCNMCGRAFSTKKDLDRHSDIHKDTKDYVCKVCNQQFKSYHTLRRHVLSHKDSSKFKCDQCHYTTALKTHFTQHMIKHKQRTNKCHICEKNLRSAKSLEKHIQNRHTFNRIFTCRFCDFTTDIGLSYSSHMRLHRKTKNDTNEKNQKVVAIKNPSIVQDLSLHLSETDQMHTESHFDSGNLSNDDMQKMTATKYQPNVITTLMSTPVQHRSCVPMLADAAMLDPEEMDITSQHPDTILINIDAASDTAEISVVSSETSMLYNMGVPPSSLSACPFVPEIINTVSDTGHWTDNDVQ